MKSFIVLTLLLCHVAHAEIITGSVKKFSGRYVETGKPYAYTALNSLKGRLLLPDFIKADAVALLKNNELTLDAEIEGLGCTDMSDACPAGIIKNVKSIKVELGEVKGSEVFEGPLQRFKGTAVESRRLFNYIAIAATSGERIAVPEFLDAEILLSNEATLEVIGVPKRLMCTDMSAACGPTKVSPLESVEIWLK